MDLLIVMTLGIYSTEDRICGRLTRDTHDGVGKLHVSSGGITDTCMAAVVTHGVVVIALTLVTDAGVA